MFKENTKIIDSHWSVNQIGFKELIEKNFSKSFLELISSNFSFSFRQRGWTKYKWSSTVKKVSIADNCIFTGVLKEDVIIYFHKAKLIHTLLNKFINPNTKWIKCVEFVPVSRYGFKIDSLGILIDHDEYAELDLNCYDEICEIFNNKKLDITYITSNGFVKKQGKYKRYHKINHTKWIKELNKSFYFIPTKQESGGLTILEHLVQGGVVLIYYKLLKDIPLDNYIENVDYFVFKNYDDFLLIVQKTKSYDPEERSKSFLTRYYIKQKSLISYLNENTI